MTERRAPKGALISRRDLFGRLGGATAATALAACQIQPGAVGSSDVDADFSWGVASGDPTRSAVVIWTRAVPAGGGASVVDVGYQVSADPEFRTLLTEGTTATSAERDFTVKVDIVGLDPGTTYYYRFRAGRVLSPAGRTRTLPGEDAEQMNVALVSCSNYPSGYFNVYRAITEIDDLDAIVHVGDYIYEHAAGAYDGETGARLGRVHRPAHEIVTLADYRERLAQYRTDPDLQAAHAHAPFISVWDDHETANNSWKDGASAHDPLTEGTWRDRRDAALQAYFEWLPMRDPGAQGARERLNRVYDFGQIASLIVIETRLVGRDQQLSFDDMPVDAEGAPDREAFERFLLADPSRSMLGPAQEAWLQEALASSRQRGQVWQVLGNQTVMARMRTPDYLSVLPADIIEPALARGGYTADWLARSAFSLPVGLDAWEGYPAARVRLYDSVRAAGANLIVLSGDSHMFWANDLHHPANEEWVGAELATGSVTSPGGYEYISTRTDYFDRVEAALVAHNRDVRHANVRDHGFIHLCLTRAHGVARYISVDTIEQRAFQSRCFLTVDLVPGERLDLKHG